MSWDFRPAETFTERKGLFIALTGGTNAGKTYSALRLARGIAGPQGKIAVLDTEGGRTLHLKSEFKFSANIMDPPFRPERFADAARAAEEAGFDVLLIDSFSMEWAGLGGVLSWHDEELEGAVQRALARNTERRPEWKLRDAFKMAAWIKPKTAHKQMVYSFLQRRMPIIFSIRGEETVKPGEPGQSPTKTFKSICNQAFPFEMTIAFRLAQDRKGYIDLGDPASWKMEGAHQAIFRDGDRLSEEHGAKLAAWARGEFDAEPEAPQPRRTMRQYLDEKLAACRDADELADLVGNDPVIRGAKDNQQVKERIAARFRELEAATAPAEPAVPDVPT